MKAAIKAKISKARVALKKATKKVQAITKKIDAKKIAAIKAKIASSAFPERKKALKA